MNEHANNKYINNVPQKNYILRFINTKLLQKAWFFGDPSSPHYYDIRISRLLKMAAFAPNPFEKVALLNEALAECQILGLPVFHLPKYRTVLAAVESPDFEEVWRSIWFRRPNKKVIKCS